MSGKRRRFTAQEKVRALRRHLVDKVPVSEVCEQEGIQPTQFYNWKRQLFEGAAALFEGQALKKDRKAEAKAEAKVEALTAKLRRKDEVLSELMEEHVALKKKFWGTLRGKWVAHDTRDEVMDFVNHWGDRAEVPATRFIRWLGIGSSKFYHWRERYGKSKEHNGKVPRDF